MRVDPTGALDNEWELNKKTAIVIKTIFFLILTLLISTKHVLGQIDTNKFNLIVSTDTTKLHVNNLKTIDYPFEVIIKHHFKKIKRDKWFLQKKEHFLIIVVDDFIGDYLSEVEKRNKYQKFILNDYGINSGYDISCRMIKKNSVLLSRENLFIGKKLFYYKYKTLDVIFISNLDIDFFGITGTKTIEFIYKNKKYEFSKNGKYNSNEILHRTFKNQPKKYENVITNYKLLNHALYFIEYNTLIE